MPITAEPNMRQIAALAGVSAATVSRVLNGNCNRASDKYKRVTDVLQEKSYIRKKRVIPKNSILSVNEYDEESSTPHSLKLLFLLNEIASRHKSDLITIHTSDTARIAKSISDQSISGVIYLGKHLPDSLTKPTVIINQYLIHRKCSSVDCDDLMGISMMLEYLREMGHKRIAYFLDVKLERTTLHPRKADPLRAFSLAGIEADKNLIWDFDLTPGSEESVFNQVASTFLSMSDEDRPTAMVLPGDTYAPVVYKVFAERGIRIPEDLSLTGFDDAPFSSHLSPPFTTVRKPIEAMCETAMELLLNSVRDKNAIPKRILICPELVLRNSVRKL